MLRRAVIVGKRGGRGLGGGWRRLIEGGGGWRRWAGGGPTRGEFKEITEKDILVFKNTVGVKNVIEDEAQLQPINTDWLSHYKGHSKVAICPENTQQVAKILRYCNDEKIAVVPQGGNTGLVGGSTPVFDEVIINMKKMNKIESFDPLLGVIVCEAGCILQNLDEFLREKGFLMPLDLGAKGSCQIGGNVSTNAGGIRYVRYGSLRGNILGLEAVLPDGTVLDSLTSLRKDNTGYDIKQLMIGSEGTLGITTKLAILAPRLPSVVNVVMLAVKSFQDVLEILGAAREQLVDILSAVEFLDLVSMKMSLSYLDVVYPLQKANSPFYVLLETSGSNSNHDNEKILEFITYLHQSQLITEGVMAENKTQADNIWRIREGIAEALNKHGYCYKYDVSVPCHQMYSLVETMRTRLDAPWPDMKSANDIHVMGYGHLGDGNLHLNISAKYGFQQDIFDKIEPYVFAKVSDVRGSISAEHGIGRSKREYLSYSKSEDMIQLMKTIKKVIDPNSIMNPYKVLPE
ncbi:hypothetical protein AAMO2058_001550200 [Amorphochlora amoebiformis]